MKRKPAPAHLTKHFFVVLGGVLIAAAVFFKFLAPEETQSSIDWSAQGVSASVRNAVNSSASVVKYSWLVVLPSS